MKHYLFAALLFLAFVGCGPFHNHVLDEDIVVDLYIYDGLWNQTYYAELSCGRRRVLGTSDVSLEMAPGF